MLLFVFFYFPTKAPLLSTERLLDFSFLAGIVSVVARVALNLLKNLNEAIATIMAR